MFVCTFLFLGTKEGVRVSTALALNAFSVQMNSIKSHRDLI